MNRSSLTFRAIALYCLVCAGTLYLFLHANLYAVNLVFSDQIDLFFAYPDSPSMIDLFLQQHGPHRRGLGSLIMYPTMVLSNFNVISIAFLTAICMSIQAIALVLISSELKLSIWTTVLLAILSLSLGSVELLTVTPNISHSALPMALTSLLVLTIIKSDYRWQSNLIECFLGLSLLFTGFGIFAFLAWCIICVLRVSYSFWQEQRKTRVELRTNALFLFASSLAVWIFLQDYNTSQAAGCAPTALSNPSDVVSYMAAISSMLLGAPKLDAEWVGYVIFFSYVVSGIGCLGLLLNKRREGFYPLIFILASGAFIANAAIGRHCLGLDSAYASRYYQLMACGAVGSMITIELLIRTYLTSRYWRVVTPTISLITILATLTWVNNERIKLSQTYSNHKQSFLSCVETDNVAVCNQTISIYPPSSKRLEETLRKTNQI